MTEAVAHSWTYQGVFEDLAHMLSQLAPLKVTGPVALETSLDEDLGFDSLDAVDLLIAANDHFLISVDIEAWFEEESQRDDKPFTVGSSTPYIDRSLRFFSDEHAYGGLNLKEVFPCCYVFLDNRQA